MYFLYKSILHSKNSLLLNLQFSFVEQAVIYVELFYQIKFVL